MPAYELFVQFLAILGLIVWAASYHFRHRKTILLVQLVSFLFWIAHFALLGATVGLAISIICVVRLIAFSSITKENVFWHKKLLVFFIVVSIITTYFTADAFWGVFALLGGIFAIIASAQSDENKIRTLFIPSHIGWIIYDLFAGSYGGALSEGILCLSSVISLFKNKRSGKAGAKDSGLERS